MRTAFDKTDTTTIATVNMITSTRLAALTSSWAISAAELALRTPTQARAPAALAALATGVVLMPPVVAKVAWAWASHSWGVLVSMRTSQASSDSCVTAASCRGLRADRALQKKTKKK